MSSTKLNQILKELRLSRMSQDIPMRIEQAVRDNIPHEELLLILFTDEIERRHANRLKNNLKKASFTENKELEGFDFAFNPQIPKAEIVDLGTVRFVAEGRPVILCGPTGVGKSHLAQALGHRAVRHGYKVYFSDARDLFLQLHAKRADGSHQKRIEQLTKIDLLIIDDLGLHPLKTDDAYDFYDLIRKRHGLRSTVITSNRAIGEWSDLFPDPLIASAALDRILENASIIELQGRSHRARSKTPASK